MQIQFMQLEFFLNIQPDQGIYGLQLHQQPLLVLSQESHGQTVMNGNYVVLKTILLAGHAVVKTMLEFGTTFLEFQQAKFTSIQLARKIITKSFGKE